MNGVFDVIHDYKKVIDHKNINEMQNAFILQGCWVMCELMHMC